MGRRNPEWQRKSNITWSMPQRNTKGDIVEDKGTCQKHGEFILSEGCPQCLAEKQGETVSISEELVELKLVGEDVEVKNYYQQAVKLQEYAVSRVIKTVEDIKIATDDLTIISRLKKAMEEKRKEYVKPLQENMKAINDNYKLWMEPIEAADSITREKILTFNREQERIRREQEEINRKRQEAAEAEMRLKGELSESVNLVEVVPENPKSVSTDMGTSGQRDNWTYEVYDFALLPDEYKVVDGSLLTAVAKKHHDQKQIPGVRFINRPIITVRAR